MGGAAPFAPPPPLFSASHRRIKPIFANGSRFIKSRTDVAFKLAELEQRWLMGVRARPITAPIKVRGRSHD